LPSVVEPLVLPELRDVQVSKCVAARTANDRKLGRHAQMMAK
jgi:hypothetical protein